ncbi:hypothetical protein [Streptomyces sp. NPDC048191]|uniref:hypothetical protein n=1 Tax=Streptomyces sp. NPDC048191 TaxID=3155484 RepID=UPI0033E7A361
MTTTDATTAAERYEIGDRDADGRYPVAVDGKPTGHIYRWHGGWYAVVPGQPEETRRDDKHAAAAHLVDLVDSGSVDPSAAPAGPPAAEAGIVPWLSPKLKPTRRNIISAAIALGRLAELAWTPRDGDGKVTGYPGADNPWTLTCELSGTVVVRWWSHLRGRNNDNTPRPEYRHEGCIPFEEQAGKVAAFVGEPVTACPCQQLTHPTTADAADDLLKQAERARRTDDTEALRQLLTQLLGPCPASSARGQAMKELKERGQRSKS